MRNMNNKHSILLIAIFLIVVVFIGISFLIFRRITLDNTPHEMTNYSSAKYQIGFAYPKNWTLSEMPNGNHGDKDVFMIITHVSQSPFIEFSHKQFANPTYDDVVCWGISESTQNRRVFAITDTKDICSNNKLINIEKFEYYDLRKNIFGRQAFHCVDYFQIVDHTGYKYTFCAKDDQWIEMNQTFMEIYKSIIIQSNDINAPPGNTSSLIPQNNNDRLM